MKVMHCPQHVGQDIAANLAAVKAVAPDLGGFSEMDMGSQSSIPVARAIVGRQYHICVAPPTGTHSQEVPAIVRKRPWVRNVRTTMIRISPELPGGGIGNDRWATVVRYTSWSRRLFYVVTHTDAAIQDLDTGHVNVDSNPRARVTATAMIRLEAEIKKMISMERREGFVTGDFNYQRHRPGFDLGPNDTRLWEHGPQRTFTRLGMRYYEQGLDYIAWTPRWHRRSLVTYDPGERVRPGHRNHSDHPWFVGTFRWTRPGSAAR